MASADDVFAAVRDALAPAKVPIAIPGDLPTAPGAYPIFKLRFAGESKLGLGRNSVGFTSQITVRLVGEVSEPIDPDNDVDVSTVVPKLLALKTLADRAIINSYPLFQIVQQLVSVSTQFSYVAEATRLAGIQCDYVFEIFESAEDFFPLEEDELAAIVAKISTFPGAGLTVALPQE